MRRSEKLAAAVLALGLVSCAKESRETGGMVQHTITAGIEGTTKVQINPEADTKLLWTANETVDVWVGETAYTFTGENASAAASATFRGTAPENLGTWVLVSPQGASTGKSGNVISATLPAVQTAVAGGFDPSAALLAGLGSGSTVTCKHLYSGIRFKLTESGIKSVSLRGNNGEKIAGEFTFNISGGTPVITGGSSETIVLNAPGSGTFSTGVWYYILCLPVSFTSGVTITAHNGSNVGYVTTEAFASFERTQLKSRESLTFTGWKAIGTAGTVYYGPVNTVCITPGGSTAIDVSPYLVTAKWQRSGIPATAATLPTSVSTLWGSSTATLSGTSLSVTAASSEGSSLIALKNGETILWSFLVWVTGSSPADATLGGELYFQWGRKDPMGVITTDYLNEGDPPYVTAGCTPITYPEGAASALERSIQNPLNYIKEADDSANDWFTEAYDQDNSLWGAGSGKTVWDPCPEGWRVPSYEDASSIPRSDSWNYLSMSGDLLTLWSGSGEQSSLFWTREPSGYFAKDNAGAGRARSMAMPVRCVRE